MTDDILVNWRDCLIRESDARLLEPGEWINDALIDFLIQYHAFKCGLDDVVVIDCAAVQLIKMTPDIDILKSSFASMFTTSTFIIVPLNNNDSVSAGGSHWSLLVFSKLSREFVHFDTMSPQNAGVAKQMATKISKIMGSSSSDDNYALKEGATPQQRNTFDCGMFAIMIAQHLLAKWRTGSREVKIDDKVTFDATRRRAEAKSLITSFTTKHNDLNGAET
jgi:sentrin-specific protease 8